MAVVVVVAPIFVVCAAVALPLLKCSHHHQHLRNLKDGYNSILNYLNFFPIILALYVNVSLSWQKPCEISTESSSKTRNFNNLKSFVKTDTKHNRIAICNTTCCYLEELILAKILTTMQIQE
jgi:hypothetical protein